MCRCLLENRTLEQWLQVTPEMVGESRGPYFAKPKAMRVQGWRPWDIPECAETEDEWEARKQKEEAAEAQRQQQEQLDIINR